MSFIIKRVLLQPSSLSKSILRNINADLCKQANRLPTSTYHRSLNTSSCLQNDEEEAEKKVDEGIIVKDVDVETSKRYMNSKAYQITYGASPVWVPYRRNHKGQIPRQKTRKTCIREGVFATGNPCPICRDQYLVVDYTNVDLIKQFVSEQDGELISYEKTGVCQKQHKNLMVALEKAWDTGFIQKRMPFRKYDYSEYYPQLRKKSSATT